MAWSTLEAVWALRDDRELDGVAWRVAHALVAHVDEAGSCFPSVGKLALVARTTKRGVRGAIKQMTAGLGPIGVTIERKLSRDGDPDTHTYRLSLRGGRVSKAPTVSRAPTVEPDPTVGTNEHPGWGPASTQGGVSEAPTGRVSKAPLRGNSKKDIQDDTEEDMGEDTRGPSLPVAVTELEQRARAVCIAYERAPKRARQKHGDLAQWHEVREAFRGFYEAWPDNARALRPHDSRALLIVERFAQGFTVDDLVRAAQGARFCVFLAGKSELQTLEYIWKDSGRVEKHIRLAESRSTLRPVASVRERASNE